MGDTELAWLLKTGELEEIKAQLTTTEDVNQEVGGRRPMHYAADFGHKDVMDFLISMGGDVNASDKHGLTPLIYACYENHVPCVKLLLEKGAKTNINAPDGKPPHECSDNEAIKALFK